MLVYTESNCIQIRHTGYCKNMPCNILTFLVLKCQPTPFLSFNKLNSGHRCIHIPSCAAHLKTSLLHTYEPSFSVSQRHKILIPFPPKSRAFHGRMIPTETSNAVPWVQQRPTHMDRSTMGQNRKKYRIDSHLINHCPTSEGVNEVSERASEHSGACERID